VYRQFKKVTKAKSIFPNDDVLKKKLFLAYRDLSKTIQVQNWALVLSHLSVTFDKRLENVL
jgi:transposase-like protein